MTVSVRGSVLPDADDVRILRALQVAPRIAVARMAAALDLSEPAVARRLRRMERDGVMRVIGVVDTGALGRSRWMMRLRCRPGSAAGIADALAERPDVRWIALTAAGSEITCGLVSRSHEQREELLGERLPKTGSVLAMQASMMLHRFVGGRAHYWAALRGVLTDAEEAALGSEGSPFAEPTIAAADPIVLSSADETLLAALSVDGRRSLVDLAAATGTTPGRVARRLADLQDRRILDFDVEVAADALGFRARAALWLRVHPGRLRAVGTALADMPEVAFATAVSGPQNLHAVVHCQDLDELFEVTSDRIGALPGVLDAEVSPVLAQIKQAGTRVVDGLLQRPASA